MYDVLEVCRHIINYSNAKDYGISNFKLQKLLYFVQAYFLIASRDKQPCFRQNIEAWDFGPVVPEAYSEYKGYGSVNIPPVKYYYENGWSRKYKSGPFEYRDDEIRREDKKLIDAVVERLKVYTATDLVSITHNQLPWQEAHRRKVNRVIGIDELRSYFNGGRRD